MEAAFYRAIKLISRIGLCVSVMALGLELTGETGERLFNKYLHAARKMVMPGSKPGDATPIGMSFNEFNQALIVAIGCLTILAGVCILIG